MYEITKILECEDCGRVLKTLTEYENQQVATNPYNYISYCDECKASRAKRGEAAIYAIHPGWITSLYDGDRHYIGVGSLVRLYELRTGEWIPWHNNKGRDPNKYIHLYPRPDGNYGRPEDVKGQTKQDNV